MDEQDDVHFRRYIAEALATLDFKTSEEPMMIIVLLNTVLAVAGLAVLNLLEEDSEGGKGIMSGVSSMNTSPLKSNGEGADGDDEPRRRESHLIPLLWLPLLIRANDNRTERNSSSERLCRSSINHLRYRVEAARSS